MQEEQDRPIVAIDGPAGSGKSTVARMLAERLGYVYIDTGAMYRSVALVARRADTSWDDPEALARVALDLDLRFEPGEGRPRVVVGGEDVSTQIRTPEIDRGSSEVSRWPGVREALVTKQRELAQQGGVVMEGRDIGSVVFPHARAKVFLTASVEERARRRTEELRARGEAADDEQVRTEVAERDRRDMEREHSPLRKADDAVELVTDGHTVEQVVEQLEQLVRQRERG
ncbi:MAG: Cytidylate kinase [Armatimonadetes bacterium]|jgi:cytidylate kinase|nr:Cytidylate kinase [Armatimonadota bacterium]